MLYPIVLEMSGREVLIVGAGHVAARKIRVLLEAGARVRVVTRVASPQVLAWAEAGELELRIADFSADLLGRPELVFAATDDPRVNDAVVAAARGRRVFASSAAGDELDFVMPAVHVRDGLGFAVWSGSPALSKRLRDECAAIVDDRWVLASRVFDVLRSVLSTRGSAAERGAFWRNLASGVPHEFRSNAVAKRFVRAVGSGAGLPLGKAEADALFEVADP